MSNFEKIIKETKTTILCTSGGIDSLFAWFKLGKPKQIYFNLGHRYADKEIKSLLALKDIIPGFDFEVVALDLAQFEKGENAFIKNRNLIFACVASNYGNEIIMGGIKGDNVGDKSPEAFEVMSDVLSFINPGEHIIVKSPWWLSTKTNILKWALENVPDAELLMRTSISCYSPQGGQCGNCPSCFRKWIALKYIGISCDDWFDKPIKDFDGLQGYITRLNTTHYDKERVKESIAVLKAEGLL